MIKVKLDRATDSIHIVEEGLTVRYDAENPDVLEVLDPDEEVIALFRGWIYARPVTDDDFEEEVEDEDEADSVESMLLQLSDSRVVEVVEPVFEAPETASADRTRNHGAYGLADAETEGPAE